MASPSSGRPLSRALAPEPRLPRRATLRQRLFRSHLAVTAIAAALLAGVLWGVLSVRDAVVDLGERRAPAAVTLQAQRAALAEASAALRGWIVLGDPALRARWQALWHEDIEPGMGTLRDMKERWLGARTARLETLERSVAELHDAQWWTAEVARSAANAPALARIDDALAPRLRALQRFARARAAELAPLDAGAALAASALERALEHALQALRSFAVDAGEDSARRFEHAWAAAAAALPALERRAADAPGALQPAPAALRQELDAIAGRAREAMALRRETPGDVARERLSDEVLPASLRAAALLDEITDEQMGGLAQQASRAAREVDALIMAVLGVLALGAAAGWWASRRTAARIAAPIAALSGATHDLVEGRFDSPLEVRGDAEVADLIRSFNRLWAAMKRGEVALREEAWANGEFLAAVSHAARTPMNGVVGLAEVALGAEDDTRKRERLELLRDSGLSLLALLDDLFDHSRLEIGRLEPTEAPFSVTACVDEALALVGERARERQLVLRADVAPEVPAQLLGSAAVVTRVLTKLLAHAVAFSAPGEIVVTVGARAVGLGHLELEIGLCDPAPAPPNAKRDGAFEPFARVEPGRVGRHGGTGLELAIAARLVELQGGEIVLERDAAGEGRLRVCLPLRAVPHAEGAAGEVARERAEPSAAPTGLPLFAAQPPLPVTAAPAEAPPARLRLLLAEDEPVNQRVAVELLRQRGHEVECVGDGRAAVDRLRAQPPGHFDIVLMDLQMPGMDGFEATAAIRALDRERGVGTPVVAMTAHAREGDRDRCLEAGMDGYLAKPIRARLLWECVEAFAQGR